MTNAPMTADDAPGLIAEAGRLLDALITLVDAIDDVDAAERIIGVAYAVQDKLDEAAAAISKGGNV